MLTASLRHRLYQDDCACVLGHYIKDLSILGRDPSKTVVLDNAPHTYPYQVSINTHTHTHIPGENQHTHTYQVRINTHTRTR